MENIPFYVLLDARRKYLGFFMWELAGFMAVLAIGFYLKVVVAGIVGSFVCVVILRSMRQVVCKFDVMRRIFFVLYLCKGVPLGGRYFL